MSGTSLDGIDAALVEISDDSIKLLGTHYLAYPSTLKASLLALHHAAHDELHQAALIANELSRLYAQATISLLHTLNIQPAQVRAIGCHGQTLRHRPDQGYTLQLGNAALLAELSGISVVSDFRSRDIAAGGQGAPLVPAFHDHMLRHPTLHRVIVNIGGISNLTNLAPGSAVTGFDCGPGNLLMDAWIAQHRGEHYDKEGAWAASGKILPVLFQALLNEPFLNAVPPKSSGRDLFNMAWLKRHLNGTEASVDVQATLLALTGHAIVDAIQRFCTGTQEIYLCGGGTHNQALVKYLSAALPDCRIQATDTLGVQADWMEAMAFAWFARQAVHDTPTDLRTVTGARHPCILGAIYPA